MFLVSQVGKLKLMTCKNNKNRHVRERQREKEKSGKTGHNFSTERDKEKHQMSFFLQFVDSPQVKMQ